MIEIGIIGFSKNNGHPYSFSAIINGYSKHHFKKIGYKFILEYLNKQPKKNFLKNELKISTAWSNNFNQTKLLAKACKISKVVKNYKELADDKIQGVIIAKDDWKNNKKIAKFFLNKNIPVFIDKPLTLEKKDLNFYKKFYNKKILMSCSGLRFSNQISEIEKKIKFNGKPNLIIGNISNDIEKYSVHLLEVIQKLGYLKIKSIKKLNTNLETYLLKLDNNINFILNCCGKNIRINDMTFFCKKGHFKIDFNDNFNAFKNTLKAFSYLVKQKKQLVKFSDTESIIKTIIKIIKIRDKN